MLLILMMFIMSYQYNPHFSVTDKPGQYIEIVKTEYDTQKNETYAILQRYEITAANFNPNWRFMQPRPFLGKPSNQEILKSIIHDENVKVVGLN